MAKKEVKPGDPDFAVDRSGVSKEELHSEMLDRHRYARDFWRIPYEQAERDMEFGFMPESQWDEWMTQTRQGRPMYTVNKLRQALKQITNDQRQNRPQAKVRAVENGDVELAEVREGLMRSIDSGSDAELAADTAFLFAVGGGFGCWRVDYAWEEDGGFDLVISKREIPNPYAVVFDPAAQRKDRRDARYAFVDQAYARGTFMEKWPDAKVVSVKDCTELTADWWQDDEVVVSEYWYKVMEEGEIVLMTDGRVLDVDEKFQSVVEELAKQGIVEQKRRKVEYTCVYQCIVSGAEILEGPTKWAGRFIPLVPVWGEIIRINARHGNQTGMRDHFFGAVRFGRDPQKMYNYERSTFIEVLADQPYSPFMADSASIAGHEDQWQNMRTRRPPALFYNSVNENGDPLAAPSRQAPPAFPAALAQAAAISSEDLKAATGIYDASLGARSNETSGKAIIARQREGDVANFDYIDNLAYAKKYDYEITNDLISNVYTTERQLRIIGPDGAEKVVEVNKPVFDEQTGEWVTLNDMTQGRFDITVTVGPSYSTQRMEAAEALMQLSNDPSPLGMLAKLGFLEALDAPGLDGIKKGARKMMIAQGLIEPGEGDEQPQPQQPDPAQMAQAQKDAAQAKNYEAQAAKNQADAQGKGIDNAIKLTEAEMASQMMGMGPQMPEPLDPSMFPQMNGGMPLQ